MARDHVHVHVHVGDSVDAYSFIAPIISPINFKPLNVQLDNYLTLLVM